MIIQLNKEFSFFILFLVCILYNYFIIDLIMDENKNDNCDSDNSYDSNSDGIDIGSYVTEEQKVRI